MQVLPALLRLKATPSILGSIKKGTRFYSPFLLLFASNQPNYMLPLVLLRLVLKL